MNDVKIYDCHNCISIFNTDKWVRYADYLILQHENKELIKEMDIMFEAIEELNDKIKDNDVR